MHISQFDFDLRYRRERISQAEKKDLGLNRYLQRRKAQGGRYLELVSVPKVLGLPRGTRYLTLKKILPNVVATAPILFVDIEHL